MISEKQLDILAFPYTKYDALICDGSIRSGKTSIMSVAFVDWAMSNFSGKNFAICSKTVGTALKNVVVPYMGLAYAKKRYSIKLRRIDNLMTVCKGDATNYFYIYGGKDESSYTLIQGITLAGVFLDEVALMTRSFVEQALARCSVENSRFWFNCNPDRPNHWFYSEWILKAIEKNALHLHFLLTDNPSLSESIRNRYEVMYSGVFHDRYIKGLWVNAEGCIYKQFAENEQSYYIKRSDLPTLREINIGVDFGGNKSQHAFVATGFSHDLKTIYVLKSKCIIATDTSVTDIVNAFIQFADEIKQEYGKVDYVYADCAEQAIINEMRNKSSYNIYNSIKNEIVDRIRCEDILLTAHRMYLVEGQNDALTDGLKNALWNEKELKDVRLDNGTTNIDVLDAFEYSFEVNISDLLEG